MRMFTFYGVGGACLIAFLLSCTPDPKQELNWDPHRLRSEFQQRFRAGSGKALSTDALQACFPPLFAPFTEEHARQNRFSLKEAQFATAEKLMRDPQGHYMNLQLADYGADSSAFFHLLDRYQTLGPAQLPDQFAPSPRLFIWQEQMPQPARYVIEGGAFGQIHLSLHTNHPEGFTLLRKALSQFNWQALNLP